MLGFEWDEEKAEANRAKHGISFEEAIAVFADAEAVVIDASREGDGESRSKVIGKIEGRLFVVVFTERRGVVRVISARRTNGAEDEAYGSRKSEP